MDARRGGRADAPAVPRLAAELIERQAAELATRAELIARQAAAAEETAQRLEQKEAEKQAEANAQSGRFAAEAETAELRRELAEMARRLEQHQVEMRAEMARRLGQKEAEVRAEMKAEIASLREELARSRAEAQPGAGGHGALAPVELSAGASELVIQTVDGADAPPDFEAGALRQVAMDAVQRWLGAGIDPNAAHELLAGWTPLHYASMMATSPPSASCSTTACSRSRSTGSRRRR